MVYNIYMKRKECVLFDRECIDCGQCDVCDLNPLKICDNCGKCIDSDYEYNAIKLTGIEEGSKSINK